MEKGNNTYLGVRVLLGGMFLLGLSGTALAESSSVLPFPSDKKEWAAPEDYRPAPSSAPEYQDVRISKDLQPVVKTPERPLHIPVLPGLKPSSLPSEQTPSDDDEAVPPLSVDEKGWLAPKNYSPTASNADTPPLDRPLNLPVMPRHPSAALQDSKSSDTSLETPPAPTSKTYDEKKWVSPGGYQPPPPNLEDEDQTTDVFVPDVTRPSYPLSLPPPPEAKHGKPLREPAQNQPFDTKGNWISFDHYVDKEKRLGLDAPPEEVPPEQTAPLAEEPAPPSPSVAPPAVSSTATNSEMAPLNRPLNFPGLPGIGGGFNVQIDSLFSDSEKALFENDAPATTLGLPDSKWQDSDNAIRDAEMKKGAEKKNLKIRWANLPDSRVTPLPAGPATKRKPKAVPPPKAPEPALSTPKDPQVCAAITAQKKRQLAAIESDRKTLDALQAAIAKLGIDSKFNLAPQKAPAPTSAPSTSLPALPKTP